MIASPFWFSFDRCLFFVVFFFKYILVFIEKFLPAVDYVLHYIAVRVHF